ncbi:winged helix-turn-helix domain-containing protein [Pedobacter sp. P351]|uniref:winged helix-turn-helix domain-containing protein n=1 Tax=Pedobacter superstes TaxID=3133441 RepID=UPI0030ACA9A2
MNFKYLSIFIAASLLILFYVLSASQLNDTDFEEAKEIIIMRKIGHEVLLHSGDSSSRVLPVKQIAENEYQIRFASQFTFTPDSLVKIIHRTIEANQLPSDYIVNVIECASNEMIFGYAILKTEQKNIVPCRGRQQSKGFYLINISFHNASLLGLPKKFVSTGIALFALVLVFSGVKIYHKKKSISGKGDKSFQDNFIRIGKYHFYNDKQYLINNTEQIELTQKESKLLYIFASAPNEIIDRNRLQKEIWEDEGIIVGRSLDVFISKLRKKLENDSTVKLVNIHGKGYKLEISS